MWEITPSPKLGNFGGNLLSRQATVGNGLVTQEESIHDVVGTNTLKRFTKGTSLLNDFGFV